MHKVRLPEQARWRCWKRLQFDSDCTESAACRGHKDDGFYAFTGKFTIQQLMPSPRTTAYHGRRGSLLLSATLRCKLSVSTPAKLSVSLNSS